MVYYCTIIVTIWLFGRLQSATVQKCCLSERSNKAFCKTQVGDDCLRWTKQAGTGLVKSGLVKESLLSFGRNLREERLKIYSYPRYSH